MTAPQAVPPISETVFLVNPAAEGGSVGRRWPELAHRAATLGLAGEALLSERAGQLGRLAERAVDEGAKLVVAVGGDGTVNEVAQGLAGHNGVDLAVIPRGTGWDFVRTYDIPRRLEDAVAVARSGQTLAAVEQNQARRGDVQREPEERGHQQNRGEGGELNGVQQIDR